MGDKEKTRIQKAIDLLEENGFYVFKAEEEADPDGRVFFKRGTIQLRIVPKELIEKN
ncbi:MAG: hypothetical protein LBF77_04475 [Spirochaetaceae bacterium]|jgi:hypothetical protein|nr:hypothetical protein [Spirochaetaceae bacterium]